MPYLPHYEYDIFVSYAHVDDDPLPGANEGWVSTLVRSLKTRLAQKLGRSDAYSLWPRVPARADREQPGLAKDSRTEGKTLAEALLAWGDPPAVAEMIQLANEGYDGPQIVILGEPAGEYERKVFWYQELRSQLEQELIQKLRSDSLVATGYDSRAAINAPPGAIPADRWRVLTPDFENSSATTAGMAITGILVYEGDPTTVLPASLTEPRLEIRRRARRVRLDDTGVSLSPRSFDLLLMLAEAAVTVDAPVPRSDIEDGCGAGMSARRRSRTLSTS